MMMKPYSGFNLGQLVSRHNWTDTVFSLRIKTDFTPYQAGQFTKLAMYDDRGDLVRRAYSIVNSPAEHQESNELEFLVITDSDGQLSPRLHTLAIGDQVLVGQQAAGFMTLDEIPSTSKQLWMLSTGTAIGPYLAMLEQPLNETKHFDTLILVHAVRFQNELTYQPLINKLQNHYQGRLHYVPIVSRESVSGTLSGRIPMLLKDGHLESNISIPISHEKAFFYLCGNPEMVRSTSETLTTMGFNKHLRRKPGQFSSENYW